MQKHEGPKLLLSGGSDHLLPMWSMVARDSLSILVRKKTEIRKEEDVPSFKRVYTSLPVLPHWPECSHVHTELQGILGVSLYSEGGGGTCPIIILLWRKEGKLILGDPLPHQINDLLLFFIFPPFPTPSKQGSFYCLLSFLPLPDVIELEWYNS